MKRFTLMTLVGLLMMAFAASAAAAPIPCGTPAVASFDFLMDYSGSMMMKHKAHDKLKFEMAREAASRLNDLVPQFNYTAGLHTFATDMEVVPMGPYSKEAMAAGLASLNKTYEVFKRITPMGDGIAHWSSALYAGMPAPSAVIIFSDGENNRGIDAVAAAQAALQANPRLTFHVVSVADSAAGQAVLDAIVALKPGSVGVKAEDIISSPHAAEEFAYHVFCGGNKLVLRSVQFALGSHAITAQSAAILDEVAAMLAGQGKGNLGGHHTGDRPYEGTNTFYGHHFNGVVVDGHTCSLGSDAFNQRLSERRAAAVKAYLVKKGVPASNVQTRGFGESQPKYDNSTEEGRRLNRRAEIDLR